MLFAKISRHRTCFLDIVILSCVVGALFHTVEGQREKQQQQPQDSFCLSQNPLIGMLKEHNVKVFDDPVPSNSKTCASEWAQHQTCCQQRSLIEYAERDTKQLRRALAGLKLNAASLFGFIKENKQQIFDILQVQNFKNKKVYIQELKDELNAFQSAISAVFHGNKAAKASLEECFHRIQEIKTNSLCYTCSGRSAHFFLKGLALMGEDDCRTTVAKCVDTWHRSILLIDAMESARELHSKLSRIIPESEIMPINVKKMQKLEHWIGSHHIRETIKQCHEGIETCPDPSSKLLCEAFISLRPRDFLSKVGGEIANKVEKTVPAENHTKPSIVDLTQKPQTHGLAGSWSVHGPRSLAGQVQNQQQPVMLDTKQDIQVVKNNQTQAGSVPMKLSGNVISADLSSGNSSPSLSSGILADGLQP